MKVMYPVIFTEKGDSKDTYLVYIPDLQGMTEGYGLKDAINMAKDYIGGYCSNKKDKDILKASNPKEIDIKKSLFAESGYTFLSVIDLDLDTYKSTLKLTA